MTSSPSPHQVGLLRWREKELRRFNDEDEALRDLDDRLEAYKFNKQGAELARIIGEKTAELADFALATSLDVGEINDPRRIVNVSSNDPRYDERYIITALDENLTPCAPRTASNFRVALQDRRIDTVPYPGAFIDDPRFSFTIGGSMLPERWEPEGLVQMEDVLELYNDAIKALVLSATDGNLNQQISTASGSVT